MPSLRIGLLAIAALGSHFATRTMAGIHSLTEFVAPSIDFNPGLTLSSRIPRVDGPIFRLPHSSVPVDPAAPLNLDADLVTRQWQRFYGETAVPKTLTDYNLLELPGFRKTLRYPAAFRPAPPGVSSIDRQRTLDFGQTVSPGFRPFVGIKVPKVVRKEFRRSRRQTVVPLDEDDAEPQLIPPLDFEESEPAEASPPR